MYSLTERIRNEQTSNNRNRHHNFYRSITDDSTAEWALNQIKAEEEERDRLKAICQEKIEFYQTKSDEAERRFENSTAYLKGKLLSYFLSVPHKETKTQETYRLPSGQLVGKKAKQDYEVFDDELLEYLKANRPEFVKTVEKPAWGDYKKTLQIVDGKVIDTETGEEVQGIGIVEKPQEFDIKWS